METMGIMNENKRAFIKKFGKYAMVGAGMSVLMTPTSSSAGNYNKCRNNNWGHKKSHKRWGKRWGERLSKYRAKHKDT